MKRIIGLLIGFLTSLSVAQTTRPTVAIDGKLDEWTRRPIYLSTLTHLVGTNPATEPDLAAVWLGRDERNLYAAFRVEDLRPQPGDAIELVLDLSTNAAPRSPLRVTVSRAGAVQVQGNEGPVDAPCAATQTADGYEIELALPLAQLKIGPSRLDHEIGVDVIVSDVDVAENAPRQYALSLNGISAQPTHIPRRLVIDDEPPATAIAPIQLVWQGKECLLTCSAITTDAGLGVQQQLWATWKWEWGGLERPTPPGSTMKEMPVRPTSHTFARGCRVIQQERRLAGLGAGRHEITAGMGDTIEKQRLFVWKQDVLLLDREPIKPENLASEFCKGGTVFSTSHVFARNDARIDVRLDVGASPEVLWTWSAMPEEQRPMPVALVRSGEKVVRRWEMRRGGAIADWMTEESCRGLPFGDYEVVLALQTPGKEPVVTGGRSARPLYVREPRERQFFASVLTPIGVKTRRVVVFSRADEDPFHPDVSKTHARSIRDMRTFGDRVYVGATDPKETAGQTTLYSFGLAEAFQPETVVPSREVTRICAIGSTLYVPIPDLPPDGKFGGYCVKSGQQWGVNRTIAGLLHAHDMLQHKGTLYLAGESRDGAAIYASKDEGKTWDALAFDRKKHPRERFTALGAVGDRLLAFSDWADEGPFEIKDGAVVPLQVDVLAGASDQPRAAMSHVTPFKNGLLYLPATVRSAAGLEAPTPLIFLDDLSVGAKRVSFVKPIDVTDVIVRGETCYALAFTRNPVFPNYHTTILASKDLKTWTLVADVALPALPMSFEELNGIFYIGAGSPQDAGLADSGAIYRIE